MSKSKSPQYIFVKLRVPGASQSLFSPFFLSVGVELDFEESSISGCQCRAAKCPCLIVSVELDFKESGIWSDLPSVAVSAWLPSVQVSMSVLSLT